MKSYELIRQEVAVWSLANFGDQESPHFVIKVEPSDTPLPRALVALGSLAPLMGIVEELGEMCEVGSKADTADAVGDVFIYICDYCSREGMQQLPQFTPRVCKGDGFIGLVTWVGRLYHCTLKRHQGIRGYDDECVYIHDRDLCVVQILSHLAAHAYTLGDDLLSIANTTWTNVVSKRDWKGKPETGGEVDHSAL